MKAQCNSCGHGPWELRKEPDEYEDGPRCADPDCRSRDIEIMGGEAAETDAARVFDSLDDGMSLVEIVKKTGIEPATVEDLAEDYARLSDAQLLYEEDRAAMVNRGRKQERERWMDTRIPAPDVN